MPLSGMPMEAFECSIRAILREAWGQRGVLIREMPLPSTPMDIVQDAVSLPSNSRPVVAALGGPAVRRKPVKILHDHK